MYGNINAYVVNNMIYSRVKVIENCVHDVEAVNALYRDPQVIDEIGGNDEEGKDSFDGYFDGKIGSHGLPEGFQWTLQCPVTSLKLKYRGKGRYYCGVCKKNVHHVRSETEMAEMVDKGHCVQFNPESEWARFRRGKVVRRPSMWQK